MIRSIIRATSHLVGLAERAVVAVEKIAEIRFAVAEAVRERDSARTGAAELAVYWKERVAGLEEQVSTLEAQLQERRTKRPPHILDTSKRGPG